MSDNSQAVTYSPVMGDCVDDNNLYDDTDVESCKFSHVKYLNMCVRFVMWAYHVVSVCE